MCLSISPLSLKRRRKVEPLTKAQQRRTKELRESLDASDLHWRIWKWQKELRRNRTELQAAEKKLAAVDGRCVKRVSLSHTLRQQRDTRIRRRKLLLLWIQIAMARIEQLKGTG